MGALSGKLDGAIAVVTGAGQGIGAGTAWALAKEGARVVVSGRTMSKVEAVAGDIASAGGAALPMRCDVTDPAAITALFAQIAAEVGPPDILINNAQGGSDGVLGWTPVETASADECLAQFSGGVISSLRCMQAAFPFMKERGGRIVNVGSSAGIVGLPGYLPHAMGKEAVHTLTKTAAREWGRYGIRVNTVCPASASPAVEKWAQEHPDQNTALLAQTPLGRFGDPERDIGRAIAMLVTDDFGYLTGAALLLDGGSVLLR